MNDLQGQHILILGLGASGLAMARWCAFAGAAVTVADTREAPANLAILQSELPQVPFVSGPFSASLVEGSAIRAVFASPGLAPSDTAPVLDAAKTMGLWTGGELLSSFQLDNAGPFEPTAATVLNVTQDHLDWHGSMDAYAAAKQKIFGEHSLMLLNRDDARVMAMLPDPIRAKLQKPIVREHITYGAGMPERPGDFGLETVNGMTWLVRALESDETRRLRKGEVEEIHIQRLMPADALRIRGRHNAVNALAALALASSTGSSLASMLFGLREYKGEPHRVEPVAIVNDIEYCRPTCGDFPMSEWMARFTAWSAGLFSRAGGGAAVQGAGDGSLPVNLGSYDYAKNGAAQGKIQNIDQALVWVVVALLMWGMIMVYSASIAMPDNPKFARYAQTHFLVRHVISIVIGFGVALLAFQVPLETWEKNARPLFILSLILLAAVLLPFIGKGVNGARRWISLGVMNFQPSEFAKLAVIIYASDYMVRKMEVKERFFRAVLPMGAAVGLAGIFLLAEPDMGAFLVIAIIAMGILFLGGVNARMFFLILAILVFAFAMIIAASPWRRERIFAYLDPWDPTHALGKGYQLSHSLIAIGRGEIFGVGLGGSVEKLHWLPEAHTDFLLAVIGEEFGLVGVIAVIGMFLWLSRRIMVIGRQALALDRTFPGLVAQGVGIWIGFQSFINMGVNLGALPTKGLTLPLMSYGGSAILLNMVAIAIVLRIDAENKQMMRGGRS
ncbi:MAG: putative lipid II flippase FtsW [Betaproteobacteria bacterium]|nr:putative lipid II flippase FtsW [Betaproteobacteria bacterium]